MQKQLLFCGLALVLLATSCSKDDNIINNNGDNPLALECKITNRTVLTDRNPSGVDYIVDCGVDVRAELIIEAGTSIQFKDGAYLEIYQTGIIKAIGTANNPIKMTNTGGAAASWAGIYLNTQGIGSIISHVQIEKAGEGTSHGALNYFKAAITVDATKVKINNVIIDRSGEIGIVSINNNVIEDFSNVKISNCISYPMMINANDINTLDLSLNTFIGNKKQYIFLHNYFESGIEINKETILRAAPIPYFFKGRLKIQKNFTIAEGVQMVMDQDATIECSTDGTRFAIVGTQAKRVIIKGENATPAYWGGILVAGKSDFYKFSYLDISDGGSADFGWGTNKANIKLTGYWNSKLELLKCTSTRSGTCDIAVHESWSSQTLINDNTSFSVCKD